MYAKSWLVIRDDKAKKYEVCGNETNTNYFTNQVLAMQKLGMSVSGQTPPVTNQFSHKDSVKVVGYAREDGLYQRLEKEYREIVLKQASEWEE